MKKTERLYSVEMTVSRKALFFDIDGTLLSEKTHMVPDSTVWALSEARKRGHLVFLNSGRTRALLGQIEHLVEADGYLCGCGTYIEIDGKALYSYHIPHQRRLQIKREILAHGLDAILEGTEACYFRKETSWIPRVEQFRKNLSLHNWVSPYGWDEDCYEFDKFCAMADKDSDLKGFYKTMERDMEVIDRGHGFYECVPAGHSKATAIDMVLKQYGIPLEDAYVFGDSTNDLSMFQYAKNAVLMGQHDKELEAYATFITKDVEEDGIVYAMEQLGIL